MKIDYVVVSTDENPKYFEFWPIVRRLWVDKIKIKPILVIICDEDEVLDYGDHIIHKIKKIDNINTGFQSQIARMFVTKFYEDSFCLTSDIDMLPISSEYFHQNIWDYSDENLIIMSPDAYNDDLRYPICYNVAKGKTFIEILDLNCSFREYCYRLKSFNWGWDTDEKYFGKKVNEFPIKNRIIKKERGYGGWSSGIASRRIDRVNWGYDLELLQKGHYIDCHSLRPYNEFKDELNKLVSFILK